MAGNYPPGVDGTEPHLAGPRETKHKRRCPECRQWIDRTSKYHRYNHKRNCSHYPEPPMEAPDR